MSQVVYRSHIRIVRERGPVRKAYIPGEPEPVTFGVHGAIAEHYKVPADAFPAHATTIDYVIAGAAG
jgi:hypothetical protein